MKKLVFSIILFMLVILVGCSSSNVGKNSTENSDILDSSFENSVKEISFKDLYGYDEIELKSIEKITLSEHPGSIAPPWITNYSVSYDKTYFERVLQFIKNVKFTECTDPYMGVGSRSLSIVTKNKNYGFSFTSQDEYYVSGKCYNSSIECPIEFPLEGMYHSLDPFSKVYFETYGEVKELDYDPFDDIYYKVIEDKNDYIDFTKDATLLLDNGEEIIIKSAKHFYFRGDYCEVIKEKDFSLLLEGVTDTTSFVQFVNEDGTLAQKMLVSNNFEYTLEEIVNKLSLEFEYKLLKADGTEFTLQTFEQDTTLIIKLQK